MRRSSYALLAALTLLLRPAIAAAQQGRPERGEALARANCGACHAIGPSGASPVPRAPAFRDLHRRYPVEHLTEALAEGIVTGHPGMPDFRLEPEQIEDLIAYLRSLQRG
ncbi:MAG TPA: cytochrome c [Acetobacteraceae bacterium]|nr:cytochrome c [Acetobacteraceae bacterium]